jgi:hypothetical protein
MGHVLDNVVHPIVDDGSPPWCHGVEGYLHPDLTHIQAMRLKATAAVAADRPIVVESDESAQELSWEPRAVSARGPEGVTLVECTVGVVIHVHMKNSHENFTNSKVINSKNLNTENCNNMNSSKEKAKNRTVSIRFCPRVEHKKFGQLS